MLVRGCRKSPKFAVLTELGHEPYEAEPPYTKTKH